MTEEIFEEIFRRSWLLLPIFATD